MGTVPGRRQNLTRSGRDPRLLGKPEGRMSRFDPIVPGPEKTGLLLHPGKLEFPHFLGRYGLLTDQGQDMDPMSKTQRRRQSSRTSSASQIVECKSLIPLVDRHTAGVPKMAMLHRPVRGGNVTLRPRPVAAAAMAPRHRLISIVPPGPRWPISRHSFRVPSAFGFRFPGVLPRAGLLAHFQCAEWMLRVSPGI